MAMQQQWNMDQAKAHLQQQLQQQLQHAKEQNAALLAQQSASWQNGHMPQLSSAPNTASHSHNMGMSAVAQKWGDPNQLLHAMLDDAVGQRLKQRRAAIIKSKAATDSTPAKARHAPDIDGPIGGWELVPSVNQAAKSLSPMGGVAQQGDQDVNQGVIEYDDYVDEEGAEDVDGVLPDMDGAFEEVLQLRLQLHDMDSENAALKRQLEQQKALMTQLQASLLLGSKRIATEEGSDGGNSTGTPATPHPTTNTAFASISDGTSAAAAGPSGDGAGRPALPPPGPTPAAGPSGGVGISGAQRMLPPAAVGGGMSASGANPWVGFDALAAVPHNPVQPPTQQQGTAAPSPSITSMLPQPAYGNNAPGATVITTATYQLDPNLDILEGLGLSHPAPQHPPPPPQLVAPAAPAASPAPQANSTAGTSSSTTLTRTLSNGALEAIRAVEQFEKDQQLALSLQRQANMTSPARPHQPSSNRHPGPLHHTAPNPVTIPLIPPPPSPWITYPAPPPPVYPPPAPSGWGAYAPPHIAPPAGGWAPVPTTPSPQSMSARHLPPAPWASPAHTGASTAPRAAPPPPQSWTSPQPPPNIPVYHYPLPHPPPPSNSSINTHWSPAPTPPVASPVHTGVSTHNTGGRTLPRSNSNRTPSAGHTGEQPDIPWACAACTYMHEGPQSKYLRCAICNAQK